MGSIRALHGWRRSYFEFTDGHGHLDADAPTSSTHWSLLKRRRSRSRGGSSGRNRNHRNKWKGMCDRNTFEADSCPPPTGGIGPAETDPTTFTTDPSEEPTGEPTPGQGSNSESESPQPSETTSAPMIDPSASGDTGDAATNSPDILSSSEATQVDGSTYPSPLVSPSITPSSTLLDAPGATSPEVSSQTTLPYNRSTNTGAIIGGVIGGVAFLLLLALCTFLFLRRRKRKRTPASAEFRDRYIPNSTPPFSSRSRAPLATQVSRENLYLGDNETGDPDPPPPFTEGDFNDPLFEKIYETQKAHVEYGLAR